MKSLAWGLPDLIPDDAVAGYGARAIVSRGALDIPFDRRVAFKLDDESGAAFAHWMDQDGFTWLDDVAERCRGNKAELYSLDDGRFHMRANTNASYGYLYVTAWMDKE